MQLAPFYPLIHTILKPTFPTCLWSGYEGFRAIALTFDDGPHPQYTPKLLDVLERYQITASFFCLGVCVRHAPEVVKTVYERGHWVGLHGYTHRSFLRFSIPELKQSLEQTQAAIAYACQLDLSYVYQHIQDVRPPNGLFTPQILTQLHQWHYRPVMWSVVPEDWLRPGIDIVVQRVLNQTRNGSLIVLHDGYFGGEDVAAIASEIIPLLLHQGYQFVTIDQLWHLKLKHCLMVG
jgi:peptidoglycan/xylan/chitin deacetylase (PgdA/CDA1 family)